MHEGRVWVGYLAGASAALLLVALVTGHWRWGLLLGTLVGLGVFELVRSLRGRR